MSDNLPNDHHKTVTDAIDRALDILRAELQNNPEFAYRIVKAVGAEVVFAGKHAAKLLNPKELVALKSEMDARVVLLGLSEADLKMMAKASGLATPVDVKGKDKDQLVDMIYTRALEKVSERRLSN